MQKFKKKGKMNSDFSVKIKYANQTKEVIIQQGMTIGQVKNAISTAFDIPSDEQKLVFKGKERRFDA